LPSFAYKYETSKDFLTLSLRNTAAGQQGADRTMEKFIGGSPLAVAARLLVISLIVGMILYIAGFNAEELLNAIPRLINAIYDLGYKWIDVVVQWLVLGAIVVVPIWAIVRVMKFVSGFTKGGKKSEETKKSS
jgi:hypothetical protein